ncbi:carbohydrate porin [Poriferisphaera sp. WC338]|uniref:carbohydrate porin n=1 Tax=Poriferisphaera sp. WC338 TaxID=3425129 RepID=UPI003D81844D
MKMMTMSIRGLVLLSCISTVQADEASFTGDWWGTRTQLETRGISVESTLTADYSINFQGGKSTRGHALRSLFDLNLTFELEPLVGLNGATVFVDAYSINGDDGSDTLIGDVQGFSNIDLDENRTQIAELWYQQMLGDRFSFKVGKMDVNGDFAFVDHGGDFIHSSPGFSPTIFGLPTYPESAFGGAIFMHATDDNPFYASIGIFDGSNAIGIRTGLRGPSRLINHTSDLFLIAESGVNWVVGRNDLPGRLGVGAWRFTGELEKVNGSGKIQGTDGMYLVFDQTLYLEDPANDEGLSMFAQYGYADRVVSEVDHHLGMGLVYKGLLAGRPDDRCGIMYSWAHLSSEGTFIRDREIATEVFYAYQALASVNIKPDLQWIVNPGGEAGRSALVGTLRVEVSF